MHLTKAAVTDWCINVDVYSSLLSVCLSVVSSSILESLFVFSKQLCGSGWFCWRTCCPALATCCVLLCSLDRDLNPHGFAVGFIFNSFCQSGSCFASEFRVLHSCSRTWTGSGDHWPSETCLLMAGQENPERTPHKTRNMPGPPPYTEEEEL